MIEAFRAVILTGSISEAANFLHISQPAISRLIKDMEVEVGFQLFDRRHGRVYANEDALSLFEEVHHFFTGLDRIRKAATSIRDHQAGSLRIACMPAVGMSVMPTAISLFKARHPGIIISLQVVRSPTVIQFLSASQCDVGLVEAAYSSATAEEWDTFHLKTVCIFPEGHPLAEEAVIRPEHLSEESFINLKGDSKTRLKIDAVFREAGLNRTIWMEAQLTAVVCCMVREGCGVAIVDPMTAASYASQGVISRPFEPSVTFSFKALSAPRVAHTSLVEEFFEVFSSTVPQNDID
ncbi:MAG: LysR family transcriptional regulator [Gammaproteobacteria bacterium]|nr:LysR family transcriptional regulator [Gammaproteobacteria bacterium]